MYQSIGMYERIIEPSKVVTIKNGDIFELFIEKNRTNKTAVVKIDNKFIDTLVPIKNELFNKVWEKQ